MAIPALVLVALACGNAAAVASPSSVAVPSLTATSPFCAKAATYSKSSPGTNVAAVTPAALKANYEKFKAVEKSILGQAPTAIKADLQKIFAFDDILFAALNKANWNFAKLPPATLQMLATKGPALEPASKRVAAYFAKVCKIKPKAP